MNSLVLYLAQASACLLVFYGFYHLVLRQETCFQYNRAYLLATPALSLLLPLAPLPDWLQPLSLFQANETTTQVYVRVEAGGFGEVIAAPAVVEQAPFPWQALLWMVYTLGCCFFAYRFLRQLRQLGLLISQYREHIRDQDGIFLVPTQGQLPTFSFFHYLFFDESQHPKESDRQKILQHETVHIRQKHSWDVLYMEILTILFWFQPLLYLYKKALASTHEYIADAQVVQQSCPREYAVLLARQVLNKMDLSLGHFFNKSLTLKRLNMLQKTQLRPSRLKQGLALPLLLLLFVLVSAGNKPEPEREQVTSHPADNLVLKGPAASLSRQGNQIPEFPGGKAALYNFLKRNLKYPPEAIRNKIAGQAIMEVVLDDQGRVDQVKALQSDHDALAREGVRVLKSMPPWQPSVASKGNPTRLIFPFLFGLDSNKNMPALRLPELRQPYSLHETVIVIGYAGLVSGKDVMQKSVTPSPRYSRDSKIFSFVEQIARFPGGDVAMNKFIATNLKYPAESLKNKLEGLVVAQFVVDRNGQIHDATIVKSLDAATDAEALRLVKSFPDFEPAKQNGRPVEFRYTLPIRFSLNAKDAAAGNGPPSPSNSTNGNVVRLRQESEPVVGCEPRLVKDSQIDTREGTQKHVLTFRYTSPEGCPGETFVIESLRYSHMRGKQVLTGQIQVAGNKIDIAKILEQSQPGDQLMVIMKGNSVSSNGKAGTPINAGTVINLK
ncbi:MAG: TonB family protein [Adhaeribacter sp.]